MKILQRRFIAGLLISGILSSSVRASFDLGYAKEDAGVPGAFLEFGASARSVAMGHAHTGVANDATATYWNPAGLTQLDRKDVVALYSALPEKTGFGVVSFAQPTVDYGSFGLSLISLRSGNFERRSGSGLETGSFDQSDNALLLSHGFQINPRWSFGTTLKGIRQQIDSFSGSGYGADVGLMMKSGKRLQTGLVFRNLLAPKVKLRSVSETYPRDIRLGLAFKPRKALTIATDFDKTEDRSIKLNLGTEWQVNDLVALRAGLNESEVTVGVGLNFKDWGLDYAFGYNDAASGFTDMGASHRMGLHFSFGQKLSDQSSSLAWQKKGQIVLELLTQQMDEQAEHSTADNNKLIEMGNKVIQHQGYAKPQDLYSAQGYIHYFKGDYMRSVQSLDEALALDPQNKTLEGHLVRVRSQMKEERTKQIISSEFKMAQELFEKGDYKGAVRSCNKVLSFDPNHAEAKAYLEDATRRIQEPISRTLKIAKAKFEAEEYLDAIKYLQKVKELDPSNKEAAYYMDRSIAALEKNAALQIESAAPAVSAELSVYQIPADSKKSRDLYSQGLLLYSQGKLREAVSTWADAVKFDDHNTLAKNAYNRGVTELKEIQ